jgi:hypothetical protein
MNEKQFLYLMFESMPCCAVVCKILFDETGNANDFLIVKGNEHLEKTIQTEFKDKTCVHASDYLSPEEMHRALERFESVVQSGEPVHFSEYTNFIGAVVNGTICQLEEDCYIVMYTKP